MKKRGRVVLLFILIFLAMTTFAFNQVHPASDILKTSAGDVEMHFVGHGSLMFSLAGFIIHVDPVRSSGSYVIPPEADLILVTHEHGDHLDTKLIGDLHKKETIMLCNGNSKAKVLWARAMKAGDKIQVSSITIEALHAYNIVNLRAPGQPFHPMGSGLGFILSIGDKKIYVAGDTENTPEMKSLKDIDVAFLPMNLPYTMTPEMVADAAMAFKPKILYPYHFGETNTEKLVQLLKNTDIEIRIRNLK